MKVRSMLMTALLVAGLAGNSFAGTSAESMPQGMGLGLLKAAGAGYGMMGAGGLKTGVYAYTMKHAYLNELAPIASAQDAATAIQNFLTTAKSSLTISELWEYQTVYKAELADTSGQKAFDIIADKLTGNVIPDISLSMMLNASWGRQLLVTGSFATKLIITPDAATALAQAFVSKNATVINYNLAAPETYPGYYKFHTTDTSGKPGMDINVNGYNGGIWMNTALGAPIAQVQ